MSSFHELEFKYKADNIKLSDFINVMESLNYKNRIDVSSWDHYYTLKDLSSFQRFRESLTPELTKKVKTNVNNNWERIEVDLPLDHKRVTKHIVEKYVSLDGYSHNFTIYKTCMVFNLEYCNYVYYITYDENLKELDRFIEVEINKDRVEELDSASVIPYTNATAYLAEAEKYLVTVGISPQNRMKKSLFELYVKN